MKNIVERLVDIIVVLIVVSILGIASSGIVLLLLSLALFCFRLLFGC